MSVRQRIVLLVALLVALIVVTVGSMTAWRYYLYSTARGSITVVPPGYTGSYMSLDGILYDSEPVGRSLSDEDLGAKFAEVRHIDNALPVYAVEGYDTSFRLAARVGNGRLIPFEAFANPRAEEASDLLDIGGKVRSISILHRDAAAVLHESDSDLKLDKANDLVLGSIEDPEEVEQLVRGLMNAPLEPTPISDYATVEQTHYLIAFHLDDGTAVARDYRMDTSRLTNTYSDFGSGDPPMTSGIVTPRAFRDAIVEALPYEALPYYEEDLESPPDSTLSYGGNVERVSVSASFCWSSAEGGGCFDGVSTIPPRNKTLYVPSGSEMVFRYEAPRPPKKVSVSAVSFDEGWFMGEPSGSHRSLKAHGSGVEKKAKGQTSFLWTIPAELPPGEYGVRVYVTDPQGDPHYVFRVMVE
jgi:hypothetical protein